MRKVLFIISVFLVGAAISQQTQYIHLNKIIDKLERGILVTGIWVSALHPSNAVGLVEVNGYPSYEESLTKPMIDYILIDMEHKPYDISELRNFLLALNSKSSHSLPSLIACFILLISVKQVSRLCHVKSRILSLGAIV